MQEECKVVKAVEAVRLRDAVLRCKTTNNVLNASFSPFNVRLHVAVAITRPVLIGPQARLDFLESFFLSPISNLGFSTDVSLVPSLIHLLMTVNVCINTVLTASHHRIYSVNWIN